MLLLIDTDVLIDHFHGHRAALDYMLTALSTGDTLAVSAIAVAEFTAGMRAGEERKTEGLLSLFAVLPVDEAIARRAGAYLRQFRATGGFELPDALIAATAAETDAVLITRNLRHYPMSDVRVIVPYERGIRSA